jgi:hypothetical protein
MVGVIEGDLIVILRLQAELSSCENVICLQVREHVGRCGADAEFARDAGVAADADVTTARIEKQILVSGMVLDIQNTASNIVVDVARRFDAFRPGLLEL